MFRVCHGPRCDGVGEQLGALLSSILDQQGYTDLAVQQWQPCFGRCAQGPNIVVERWRKGRLSEDAKLAAMLGGAHPDYRFEHNVAETELADLVERHIDMYWDDRGWPKS